MIYLTQAAVVYITAAREQPGVLFFFLTYLSVCLYSLYSRKVMHCPPFTPSHATPPTLCSVPPSMLCIIPPPSLLPLSPPLPHEQGKTFVYDLTGGGWCRYSSYGRHFTKQVLLQQVAQILSFYLQDGDTVVDFSCGANAFLPLVKQEGTKQGLSISGQSYDIITSQNLEDFQRCSWMDVRPGQLLMSLAFVGCLMLINASFLLGILHATRWPQCMVLGLTGSCLYLEAAPNVAAQAWLATRTETIMLQSVISRMPAAAWDAEASVPLNAMYPCKALAETYFVCTAAGDLPAGDNLVIGLNPPFGKNNALAKMFVNHAASFQPRVIVLIVPPGVPIPHGYRVMYEEQETMQDRCASITPFNFSNPFRSFVVCP